MSNHLPEEPIRPVETIYYDSPMRCMYCSATGSLTDEHVIPYFMAGAYVVRKSSCSSCQDITRRIEEDLSYSIFYSLRERQNLQSRSRKKRGNRRIFEIIPRGQTRENSERVLADQLPGVFFWPQFEPAGILTGKAPTSQIEPVRYVLSHTGTKVSKEDQRDGTIEVSIDRIYLMRLAAKIAHGFLFSNPSLREFEPLLQNVILTGNYAPFYVGCPRNIEAYRSYNNLSPHTLGHQIDMYPVFITGDNIYEYIVAIVHLFVDAGGPIFEVVAARKKRDGFPLLADQRAIKLPYSIGEEVPKSKVKIIATIKNETSQGHIRVGSTVTSDPIKE